MFKRRVPNIKLASAHNESSVIELFKLTDRDVDWQKQEERERGYDVALHRFATPGDRSEML